MNWKKIFTGEPMGDPNDPHYADIHEGGSRAGHRFARFLRLDKLSAYIYRHSNSHKKVCMFIYNTTSLLVSFSAQRDKPRRPVTEYMDSLMLQKKQQHMNNVE